MNPAEHRTADDQPIVTVQQHILREQKESCPHATGAFSWLLSGITLATKMTQAKVRRAGLLDVLGEAGGMNIQGEEQQKLDVYANEALLHCLRFREHVAILASEEDDDPVVFEGRGDDAKYIVVVDPLDGSSNIDVNVSVGTIFSIFAKPAGVAHDDPDAAILQPGTKQLAAGYVVYGSSTILVYTTGHGVHGFTLDPDIGAYLLSHEDMRMPTQGKYYSTNEANIHSYAEPYQQYIEKLRSGALGKNYSSRYIGSLVADFHRTLLKGGVFLYPPTDDYPVGKLRLMYEAMPIAFLAEQAGGMATDGSRRILEIVPEEIHQRVPLFVGGKTEMNELARCVDESSKTESVAAGGGGI
ncbi:MAG: class 1 fructose-bisphosphatase [Planctomycetales bacterium]|nr:class 1 fructose-bisphosphatase [Planctomycetales bacterium]